ncbi:MAG: hypothetical protein KAR62_05655 [Sphingomonadales bacterium]|nr:hypothetical protein [Sphingomonadales bacterium]
MNLFENKNCLNCSFLCKTYILDNGFEHTNSLGDADRKQSLVDDFSFVHNEAFLNCRKQQWHEGANGKVLRPKLKNRRCRHYFSHKKGNGLTFDAMEEHLQLNTSRFRFWIIAAIGFITAIMAILAFYYK